MHGLVRRKDGRRCSCARGVDVSFRNVTIKIPEEDMTRDVRDVTLRKRGLKFEKKQFVEIETWAKRDEFVGYGRRTWFGADGKVSIERLCLTPYVEKPFNSKVIKSFVPELRSLQCFRVSVFLCYIWTFYEHYMYVSHIHVCVCYTDFFDSHLPSVSIIHHSQQDFKTASCVGTGLLLVISCWSTNTGMSI